MSLHNMKLRLLSLVGMIMLSFSVWAQVPQPILESFNTGNAVLMAGYFNQNVELVVMEKDNVYSRAQAEQIISNFFSSFTPVKGKAFSVIHESGKGDAQSVIGQLRTDKGEFRVYFLLKKNGAKAYIHQLRIERT